MLSGPVAEEGISSGRKPPEQGADFVRRQAPSRGFSILTGESSGTLRSLSVPGFFLIDREGRIAAHYLGLRDWASTAVRQELTEKME
jgi:hypothetical protein